MVDLASTFSIKFFSHWSNFLESTHTQLCLKFKKWQEKRKRWGHLPQQGCRNDDGGHDNGCFTLGHNGTIMSVVTCDEIAT